MNWYKQQKYADSLALKKESGYYFNPSQEEVEKIKIMLSKGDSLLSISKALNKSYSTIRQWLTRNGYIEKTKSYVEKPKRFFFSNEYDPLVAYMYLSPEDGGLGQASRQIAENLNVSHGTILNSLKRSKVQRRPGTIPPCEFSENDVLGMKELYEEGYSVREIAEALDVSTNTAKNVMDEQKIQRRSLSDIRSLYWQKYPGGFPAYLSQFSPEKQAEIMKAVRLNTFRKEQP